MLKSVTSAISAIAAAAAIAAALTVFPGASEPVSASSSLTSNKGDRLDVRVTTAPDCSQQAWPYYDAVCIKDRGHKAPRVVTTDRVPLTVNR